MKIVELPLLSGLFRPRQREGGLVAIVPGARGVHLAQVRWVGDRPQVLKCLFYPENEVTSVIFEKIRKELRIDSVRCTTLLSASEYQILMVEAPNVPVDELKSAIRWKIKDALHCHVDDATIDVLLIPTSKYGSDRSQSLYAIAASNETVRRRIALFENAKLGLEVIDIPEMAQRNIAALYEEEERGIVMLTVGDEGGLLTVTQGGELFFARRIEITLGQLQDADEYLRQQFIERVELEVQRSLDYFDRLFQHISVNRMLVCVPDDLGLVQRLSASLDLPVERLDLAQVMDIEGVQELADSEFACHAIPALGAALRREKKVL